MNNPKTKVVKSKSSNSAITTKSTLNGKSHNKSKSRVEIKNPVKKRGVYVEKKPTKSSISETVRSMPKSPKHVPRPGKKLFLNSVFTILSKSTTGTQFPDSNDSKKINKNKFKIIKKKIENINDIKKKKKYRSKVLNENKNFDNEVIVLEPTRDLGNSPSNYSERSPDPEPVKWSEILPPLVTKNDSDITLIDTSEIKNAKQKRVTLVENKDPVTLLSRDTKKDDKKLYNFFVDLLETTFDVYNVNTELKANDATLKSSKILLDVNQPNKNVDDFKTNNNIASKHFDDLYNHSNDYEVRNETKNCNYCLQNTPISIMKPKRKMRSESFEYRKKKPIPFSNSITYQQSVLPSKKVLKKDHKKNFLNILKEELKMNSVIYEEPQNFFQALKVMARNKRKYQNTENSNKKDDNSECVFKRRKLLSSKSKSEKKKNIYENKPIVANTHSIDPSRFNKKISSESDFESTHSIKVYGFDYEATKPNIFDNLDSTEYLNGNRISDYKLNDDILNFSVSSITLN